MANTKATKEPGIQFIEGIKGSHYRVQIRLKGCPHLSKNFDSFEEAKISSSYRRIQTFFNWLKLIENYHDILIKIMIGIFDLKNRKNILSLDEPIPIMHFFKK